MKALQISFDGPGGGYSGHGFCLVPIEDNMDHFDVETVEDLITAIEATSFGYGSSVIPRAKLVETYTDKQVEELKKQTLLPWGENVKTLLTGGGGFVDSVVLNSDEVVKCEETDMWIYKESAYAASLYWRPFDENPQTFFFCTTFAYECYIGRQYSKDFAFFHCVGCGREICEQNPDNGWHIQYAVINECEQICLRCKEKQLFDSGVDVDEIIRTQQVDGMFLNTNELLDAGFQIHEKFDGVLLGSGYSGYADPQNFFDKLQECREDFEGKTVIINYENMAIGGLGGYISVWIK